MADPLNPIDPDSEKQRMVPRKVEATAKGGHACENPRLRLISSRTHATSATLTRP